MPTTIRAGWRDPVSVAGRRGPVFVDQHNWLAQSAGEVTKLAAPLSRASSVARSPADSTGLGMCESTPERCCSMPTGQLRPSVQNFRGPVLGSPGAGTP
jgi:hypothetical protein